MSNGTFKFRKNDQIGAAGAEQDDEFLSKCFVDTGDLALLEDINDRRSIVLGRTGTGKSAILIKLHETQKGHVIRINPENLALTYVTNSTILNYFSRLGVNLDSFFKLLWRHVFVVEILRNHFKNGDAKENKSLLDRLRIKFSGNSQKDKEMREAIVYLTRWG